MATDYRYDQFNDVLETVERVELHIVPSVSPYIIHLDEVPLRGDPSTVQVREVLSIASSGKEYGRTFTEVAEPPAKSNFRLDYNTGADGDANWNTGAMLFNAADASVMVEVTYQATGTLASLKTNHYPSWWTDRGDGSDGDFYPTEDTTIYGIKNYASVFIPAGVTVTVSPTVLVKCQGAFINKGKITADGQGAAGAPRDKVPQGGEYDTTIATGIKGESGNVSLGGAGGATVNGDGGGAGGAPKVSGKTVAVQFYRTVLMETGDILSASGSGGGSGAGTYENKETGAGGAGGGGILIAAGEVYNSGTISANGASGENCGTNVNAGGGGGGGGAVVIVARRITNTGVVTASGGAAGVNTTNYKPGLAAAGGEGYIAMKEVDGL